MDIYTVNAIFKDFPPAAMYCTSYILAGDPEASEDARILLYGENLCKNHAASVYFSACEELSIEKDGKTVLYFDGKTLKSV